jgi:hypothetical protein
LKSKLSKHAANAGLAYSSILKKYAVHSSETLESFTSQKIAVFTVSALRTSYLTLNTLIYRKLHISSNTLFELQKRTHNKMMHPAFDLKLHDP